MKQVAMLDFSTLNQKTRTSWLRAEKKSIILSVNITLVLGYCHNNNNAIV